MSAVHILKVSSKSELDRFITVPQKIYANDAAYVPQLVLERRDALTPGKNPYFEHAEAAYFVAVKDGRDVGRISAQIDRLVTDPAVGHFGMIDAVDDPEVFAALFAAAESWLKERGKTHVLGPFSLSINEETGLLIKGFDSPPMVFMAHHPQYAGARVEQQGYVKARDLLAYLFDMTQDVPKAARKLIDTRKPAAMIVRNLDMKRYYEEFDTVTDIFNDAWSGNWGFIPFTRNELQHLAKSLKPIINPSFLAIVEFEGKPVGFGITLPNLNEVIRDFDGKLFPFNILRMLWRLKKGPKTGRVPLMGVRRTLHAGILGALVPFLIIDSMRKGALQTPMEKVELSWILEDNKPMRHIIESLQSDAYKWYRVYEKRIG